MALPLHSHEAPSQMSSWVLRRAGNDSKHLAAYIPTMIGTNINRTSRQADQHRRDELFRAVEHLEVGVLASENEKKINGIRELLIALLGEQAGNALAVSAMLESEKSSTSVLEVAGQKAQNALQSHIEKTGDEIDQRILDIITKFELIHILSDLNYEDVQKLMPRGVAFLGADVNFWQCIEPGVWKQQHKLDRLGRELSDQEFLALAENMKEFYCHPKEGCSQVMWDIGVVVLNGAAHEFRDQIEIISEPIDEWLFWQYLFDARQSGKLYSYNPHFALIECLIENDKIKSLAVISKEERMRGLTIAQKRFKPTQADLGVVQGSIKGNRPPRING